eukprot:TRINITY_DN9789_c0_g1_i3.p1 TRINITY_DN9789_c0_g1~~TRINITY_DN9789_c0_g1_i3.p1  ORF type:complete len:572 (-),score=170.21 TRINITY_DN9789_c0_g1_i3:72-1787(-)
MIYELFVSTRSADTWPADINKALHFLEQVIVTLQKQRKGSKGAVHIPYRNSKITQVLRDSLGGNCVTSMVATIGPAHSSLHESIATCRFAKRVACISNRAVINEHLDPRIEIARLKKEVDTLKAQLMAQQLEPPQQRAAEAQPLPVMEAEVDLDRCHELITGYLEDRSPEAFLLVPDPRAAVECFRLMKDTVMQQRERAASDVASRGLAELRAKLAQRDREVKVLVTQLNALKKAAAAPAGAVSSQGMLGRKTPLVTPYETATATAEACPASPNTASRSSSAPVAAVPPASAPPPAACHRHKSGVTQEFLANHPDSEALMENTQLYKNLMQQGKAMGQQLKESRNKLNGYKALLEQFRISRALRAQEWQEEQRAAASEFPQESEGEPPDEATTPPPSAPSPEEEVVRLKIENEQKHYKAIMLQCQDIKRTTQTLEAMLRSLWDRVNSDFALWSNVMTEASPSSSTTSASPRTAVTSPVQSPRPPPTVIENAWQSPSSASPRWLQSPPPAQAYAPPLTSPRAASTPLVVEDISASPRRGAPRPQPATGIAEADAEIERFYRARDDLLKKAQK